MYFGVQCSFDWTDGQLWNSAMSMLETEVENVVNRSSLWDDKDGAIANGAQKCHLQLHFGKRIQREMFTLLNLRWDRTAANIPSQTSQTSHGCERTETSTQIGNSEHSVSYKYCH